MFYAKYVALAVLALFSMFGCAQQPVEQPQPQKICCLFVMGGDMLIEDLMTKEECLQRPRGEVVAVDPGHYAPHPCCPDSAGPTCGDPAP